METVAISDECQVAIPRAVCESLGLEPGQEVQVIAYEGRIVLVPLRSAQEMIGLLVGLDTRVPRESERAWGPAGQTAKLMYETGRDR